MTVCRNCGAPLESGLRGRPRVRCGPCAVIAHRETVRLSMARRRARGLSLPKKIGTGFLHEHRSADFASEQIRVEREMRRLGLQLNTVSRVSPIWSV